MNTRDLAREICNRRGPETPAEQVERATALLAKARLEEAKWLINAFCLVKSVYSPLIQTHMVSLRQAAGKERP